MPTSPKKKKNGRWAKNRGDAYEREIAAYINEHVFDGASAQSESVKRAIPGLFPCCHRSLKIDTNLELEGAVSWYGTRSGC